MSTILLFVFKFRINKCKNRVFDGCQKNYCLTKQNVFDRQHLKIAKIVELNSIIKFFI